MIIMIIIIITVISINTVITITIQDLLIEKEPVVNTYISVPKDKGVLNCAAFVAGIIQAMLEMQRIYRCQSLFISRRCNSSVVPYPIEDVFFFDVETCVQDGHLPTLAVALSNEAWLVLNGSSFTRNII
uniref:DNApol_Exo domain-containing protein n=1 Tax=Heterorhabditis bacteriophora TaxID=37862 RepID=A0A1I7XB83_HETBA